MEPATTPPGAYRCRRIQELRRVARDASFDEQLMPDLNSEAIDFRTSSELFGSVRKLQRRDLESLRLTAEHQGRQVPTVGGYLLFGKDRARHFPDAWIQVGRFEGADKRTILDHANIRSSLPHAIDDVIGFIEKHARRGAVIGRVHRRDRWSVPPIAVREAVINSVAHADYSQQGGPIRVAIFDDRIEIENPGLLPFRLTVDDLQHGPRSCAIVSLDGCFMRSA